MLAAPVMVRGLEACFVNRYWCCSRCFKRRVIVRNHNTLSAVLIPYLISSATRHTGVTNVGDLCGVVVLCYYLFCYCGQTHPGLRPPLSSGFAPGKETQTVCWQTPPTPTVPSAFSSLSSPGRTGDSLFLNKAILPHPIHVLCLDFSIWSTKTRIFWSQTCTSAGNIWWS
jgi:hypothetical protein